MKKATRKIYLSLIMVILSVLAMVATTYAWVGIVSNSIFEQFSINLKENDEGGEYGIQLSLDGITFHDSLEAVDVERVILINMGYSANELTTSTKINELFRKVSLDQATVVKENTDSNYLDNFKDMAGYTTNKYFKFDVYIALYKTADEDEASENYLDVYLRNYVMSGGDYSVYIPNEIVYPSTNPTSKQILDSANNFELGKTISGKITGNVANSTRLAIQRHKTVDKGVPSQYNESDIIQELTIYQNGKEYPNYNESTGVYDFGGILPDDYNFAWKEWNATHNMSNQLGSVPEAQLNRGDVTYADDGTTNHIIEATDKVTTAKMVKLTVLFWFEGWDSDCYEMIDRHEVTINLEFSNKSPID